MEKVTRAEPFYPSSGGWQCTDWTEKVSSVRFIFANLTRKFWTEQSAEFTGCILCTNSKLTIGCLDLSDFTKLRLQIYIATALYSKQYNIAWQKCKQSCVDANRKFGQLFECIGLLTTQLSPKIVMKNVSGVWRYCHSKLSERIGSLLTISGRDHAYS